MSVLGQKGLEWFEARGIGCETVARFEISTGRAEVVTDEAGERRRRVVPDPNGNILIFPFIDGGRLVGEKYREIGEKKFWQREGGRRTFWNADILDDPALEQGRQALIITEGEPDALAAIDSGFPFTVSVPDGAPAVPDGRSPDELDPIDPDREATGKFEFMWHNRDRLKRIKRFIIAVDSDPPGQRLAAELVRRLSAARCLFVAYPEGCKDLNDVLFKHGAEAVARVVNGARPYPVRGLYRLSEYPQLPAVTTFSSGWPMVDRHLRLFAGEFMVVTGIPGHGKSTWVLNLTANLAERYQWTIGVFSPEMPTVPHLRDKLRRIRLRRNPIDLDWQATAEADAWIDRAFVFIDSDPTGREDDDFDLDWILEKAGDAVLRDGIAVLIIDPWNEVEHARGKNESMTDYIGRSIRALKRFARLYNVIVIVVSHPTKDVGKEGKARPVTLYDIEGSAHWFNKCDHGVVVDRPDAALDETVIRLAKVRFEETGEKGAVRLRFDRETGRYYPLDQREAAA